MQIQINIGSFTRAVTKASDDRSAIIAAAKQVAASGRAVLVKRDFAGRWQGWAKRENARGAAAGNDYTPIAGHDRNAERRDTVQATGAVYVADTNAGSGSVDVTVASE